VREQRENHRVPVNKCRILIGASALLVGTLVYLVDRHPEHTYFVSNSGLDVSFYHTLPSLFGSIGNHLPTFLHVFAFILITAGLMACRKKGFVIICLSWLLVDGAFELSQKYKSLAAIIPDWFAGIPFLENTTNFILHGTFDSVDMISIFLGASLAYIVLLRTDKMEKGWSHEKQRN
jgi:hypothetical protein